MKADIPLHDVAAIFTFLAGEAIDNLMKSELDSFCFNTTLPTNLTRGEDVVVRVDILNGCIFRIEFPGVLPEVR
jgi:hypothetical protein